MADNLVGGVTESQLNWSEWWVNHREQVRKVGIGFFVFVDVILLGVGAWGFTDWLALGGLREENAIRQMTGANYGRFAGVGLTEVEVGAPFVLPGGVGKIDILAPIENSNSRFWAEIEYHFTIGGTDQPSLTTFVLPGQAKYLVHLGAPSDGGSVELKIDRRVWHRAGTFGAESLDALYETRLDIRGENPVFVPADPLATTPVSSANFTLANHTAFGYYDVDLLVLLYRGDAIVGANKIRVDALQAGEKKPMELFWYQILPQVSRVEVVPDINIYDESVYRSPAD
ncbi:MAG TPA: hypothetical protein VL283_00015 [Candidatus Baltobacteraceae bacterium]|nr:hypothetical protein [Candidatus Baltobacteraceae bacterium]